MTASDQPHRPAGIGAVGLLDVLRGMLRHRKKLIIISTLLFAALGYFVIAFSTPIYTASSQVLIEYEETPYTRAGVGSQPATPRQITDRDVRSQVEVIRSHDMALKVLRKLNLIGTPEFDPLKRGLGTLSRLKIALGFSPDPRRQTPEQRALSVWDKRLKVYNLPNTKVIVIEYDSASPRTAAAVANTLAEFYIEQTRSTRLAQTGEARAWLRQQIEKLRQKVVEAEKAVENYRARAGLFQGVQSKLHNQELSELSAQIVRAAAERSQAEAKAKAIRQLLKQGRVENSTDVLNSRLIQRLREQQAQVRRRLAELSTIYLDNHPRVRAVRREMADLKRQIDAEARKIAESLEQQARIAATREAELRARQARLKARVSAASQDEVKLRELEREAKAQRSLLESFLARYTDALTRDNAKALPGMARIIARAIEPAAPSFPRPGPIMLLSVLAGLVLGLGLAFLLEVMAAVQRAEEAAHAGLGGKVDHAGGAAHAGGTAHAAVAVGTPQPYDMPPVVQHPAGQSIATPATHAAAPITASPVAAAGATAPAGPADTAADAQSAAASIPAAPACSAAEAGESATAAAADSARLDERLHSVLRTTPATAGAASASLAGVAAATSSTSAGKVAKAEQPPQPRQSATTETRLAQALRQRIRSWHDEDGVQLIALGNIGLTAEQGRQAVLQAARALAGEARVILLDVADALLRLQQADRDERLAGLGDMLAGKAGFADIVRSDDVNARLHLAAAGRQPVRTAGEAGERLRELFEALRESYDLVLLHEGLPRYPLQEEESVLPLAEAVALACDGKECGTAEALAGLLRERFSARVAVVSGEQPSAAGQDADVVRFSNSGIAETS